MAPDAPPAPTRADRIDESEPDDQRSRFQRDRDRILYTSALRRLAGITQVVSASEGEQFHNRLTHTLEVAQISRRLAEKVLQEQPEEAAALGGVDPDVVEAAGLAHDLGHPPFGHIAERELDEYLKSIGVTSGFEGNAQSFRVVTKLAVRRSDQNGLNLTRATLNAILKYPWLRAADGFESKKWSAYRSEENEFNFARALGPGGKRKSVEAELMDWADDIAYAAHDAEDFFRAGLIPLHRLIREDDERERFLRGAFDRWRRDETWDESEISEAEVRTVTEQLFPIAAIKDPYNGSRSHRAALRSMTSTLIARYISGVKLASQPSEKNTEVNKDLRIEIRILKELPWYYVINDPGLSTQQYGQRQVIKTLVQVYSEAAESPSDWSMFPLGYKEELQELGSDAARKQDRMRVVADFIASMPEPEAVKLAQRLSGTDLGSVLDTYTR